jgi:serine phosphatase RsbU (regulator of sigma subunit)
MLSVFGLKAQKKEVSPFLSKFVSNYSVKDYGKNLNAQCWSVCQDDEGLMYFGNSANIITFDGMHWDAIPVSSKSGYVKSLLSSKSGSIYWGYDGDFGKLIISENGKKSSVSFLEKVPELDRYFSTVWRIYDYHDKIVFFTQESIFIYDDKLDSIQVIYPEESFHLAFVSDGELYARDRAFGMRKFDGKQFQNVAGGEVFHNEGIFGIIPIEENKKMIITQLIGLYMLDENGITPILSSDIEELNQQQIIGALKLSDGNIALNTASNGVVVINQKGQIIHKINQASGIADNDVKQVFQDEYDNLWLATNNGISRVNYSSPVSLFLHNDKSGLYGSVNALAMRGNQLFVGTTTGLYTYSTDGEHVFERVPGLSKNITTLNMEYGDLFVGTDEGVYRLNGQKVQEIATMNVRSIFYSHQNTRLYVIGENGLAVFQSKIAFGKIYENKNIALSGLGALILESSNQDDELWIGTMTSGLWHLSVPRDLRKDIGIENYYMDDNLPQGWVKPFLFNDSLLVGTSNGLYQLEEITAEGVSDSVKYKPYFINAQLKGLDGGVITSFIRASANYYTVFNGVVGTYNKTDLLDQKPFLSIDLGKINTLLADDHNMVWVGANDGLARVDLNLQKDYSRKPDCSISKISFSTDSILFYYPDYSVNHKLDYDHNSFSIQFSSLYDENGQHPMFSYRLDGYDDNWSPWTEETIALYKKLRPGKYEFQVRAMNIYGIESDTQMLSILVLAPWYLTWWAYTLYALMFILLIIVIVKAYTYRLKQKNIQLEEIISERTHEIREQKEEIEKQRDLIEAVHEEIQSSIAYAKRIQTAVLPEQEFEQPIIKEYFILFKPKDVVSGDFYWAKQNGDNLILAVADCTGHGVPGAFMSMLGISLLNEIVGREQNLAAGTILDQLREGVIKALRQHEDSSDLKDGMDVSLVSINLKSGDLSWAGAHNPLFIISKSEPKFQEHTSVKIHESKDLTHRLFDVKADKMPIAISGRMNPFVSHQIKLQAGDSIYMFSDGYIDQFGGPKGKKFMIKAFRNMLLDNFNKDMHSQKQSIDFQFNDWLSYIEIDSNEPYKQIDDICIMGIRF